jgi:hypothetical protein
MPKPSSARAVASISTQPKAAPGTAKPTCNQLRFSTAPKSQKAISKAAK